MSDDRFADDHGDPRLGAPDRPLDAFASPVDAALAERLHDHPHHDHRADHDHDHADDPEHPHAHGHAHDHAHSHDHDHVHAHDHAHVHGHAHVHDRPSVVAGEVLVIRPNTGVSGDILLAGLARMADLDGPGLAAFVDRLAIPVPPGAIELVPRSVAEVAGWTCRVELPDEHAHRTLADILTIIAASALTDGARRLAAATFTLLAEAEGRVHGQPTESVTFHEVGALDSILDICVVAALYDLIAPAALICGPLPLCDGVVRCAHGLVPAPAPAVLELLDGVPVRGLDTTGETITPTGIALLKGLGADFGPWPAITVSRRALVYGSRVFPGVPNGAIFVRGTTPTPPHAHHR